MDDTVILNSHNLTKK